MKIDKYKNLEIFHFADTLKKDFSKTTKQCLIFGNFGAMNMGDEAILAGELQELKKIPGLEIIVVSRNEEYTEKVHRVKAIPLYNLGAIINKITKSDFIIVGGGGIICKNDRHLVGFIYQLYMLFLYLLLPIFYGKKIYALGLGIYNNANPIILYIATYLLRFSEIISVRDYHSLAYLKSKQIKADIYKDNSYLMNMVSESEIKNDSFFKKNFDSKKRNIGLALLKPDSERDEKHLVAEIKKMINKNYKNTNFWFYPCDFQNNYFNDHLFAEKIYNEVKKNIEKKQSMFIVPTEFSPSEFFSSFKLMDFFITMRLHGAIFSYRNNINFLGVTYDEKCSSFIKSIGKSPVTVGRTNLMSIK